MAEISRRRTKSPMRPAQTIASAAICELPTVVTVRPAGIEPAACGLKDRCSLAPRREPLTTELRARAAIHRQIARII